MKILITGGAGFQGSHLSEFLLKQGHEVTVLNTYSKEIEPNLVSISSGARIIFGSIVKHPLSLVSVTIILLARITKFSLINYVIYRLILRL